MGRKIKVGILRETKIPIDNRVPLTPLQIKHLQKKFHNIDFIVQPSKIRCFKDEEYKSLDIPIQEDLSSSDIIMGVKEVDRHTLIPGKTYLYFAHVAKKQPYNHEMFKEIVNKNIRLIDYEYLTNNENKRVVAFGRWAGIIGAYHGIRAYGLMTKDFKLNSPHNLSGLEEMWREIDSVRLKSGFKILVTGRGRVAHGAIELLNACKLKFVNPDEFLHRDFNVPVVCQLSSKDYYKHKNGNNFNVNHFHQTPEEYVPSFLPYTKVSDLLITGHFWDPRSSALFTKNDMKKKDFKISVVADITCDIDGSIPCTIKATTIDEPFFYYNPELEIEEQSFSNTENIVVMSIDNLASELPRDASTDFGNQLIDNVLHGLFTENNNGMIDKATITKNGELTSNFKYLSDYLSNY